jgi:hypothetical protein
MAEELKLKEMQELIQGIYCYFLFKANRNPMGAIFGTNGDASAILSDAFDAVENEKDAKKKDHAIRLYKLLLALNAFDLNVMQSTVNASKRYSF